MTFSVVARDAGTGQLGVGAITAMVAVGKLVAHARPRTGAVATQAMINPYLAFDGLCLMGQGASAPSALEQVVAADPGRDFRQCGMIDARGRTAAWTGERTPGWSGQLEGEDCVAQGNRLVGPETLEAVVDAFGKHDDLELAERLLVALEAGEATGADRQGAVSGTISVVESEQYPLWDIRVDRADDPAAALRELHGTFGRELVPQVRMLSTRDDPLGEAARQQGDSIG